MNKLASIIRVAVVLALYTFAFLYLFGEELDESPSAWMLNFLIDKALALFAIYVVVRLYKRWSTTDPWFIAYEKWRKETEDTPNPMRHNNNEG